MGEDFFITIERLELISFFAAYPLLYFFIHFTAESFKVQSKFFGKIKSLLPYAYALSGLAFTGYQIHNLYPDFSVQHIKDSNQLLFLKVWAIFSIIFLMPFFARKPIISLLHSLIFFSLLLQDLYQHLSGNKENIYTVKNDMKVYTDSILIQITALIVIIVLYYTINSIQAGKANKKQDSI